MDRFESSAETAASALFAAAVGYSAYGLAGVVFLQPQPWPFAAVAVAVGYFVSARGLESVGRSAPDFAISVFDVREIEMFEAEDELLLTEADRIDGELMLTESDRLHGELVLTDADRLQPGGGAGEPLELDDILTEMGPEARVVRLFDRRAMPTPGQLKSRIDSHLDQSSPPSATSDASQALSAALAELRRSLR